MRRICNVESKPDGRGSEEDEKGEGESERESPLPAGPVGDLPKGD